MDEEKQQSDIQVPPAPGASAQHGKEKPGRKDDSDDISGWALYVRVLKHADGWDWLCNIGGSIAAIASGAALGKSDCPVRL